LSEPTGDDATPAQPAPIRSRSLRWLYLALGGLFFGLGVIGVLLPLVPTTPFMLLALWAFTRSSRRLESWLLAHRRFGPPLRRWREHRVVPLRAKLVAWGSMALSLTWMAVLMAYAVWFVARLPSKPPPGP
jgi:uncharacterized membrane protein YbaN (DUF454 family)